MAGGLAVVLSGGGAKGAFQVGVLEELIVNRGVKVDIVVGVSTGALQALGVAQDDVPEMVAQWLALTKDSDIYTKRPLGVVGGILGENALFIANPLRRLIEAFADEAKLKASGIKMLLGVVNLGTGAFRTIDESVPGIHNWVYASCAMPVFFDPLLTKAADGTKEQWVDGGVRDVTPLDAALEQNPRGVIVVRASPKPQVGDVRIFPNLIKIGLRAVDILQSEVSINDTRNATLINDMIAARESQFKALEAEGITGAQAARILRPLDVQLSNYRFAPIRIIEPEREYSETLEFNPAKIREAIAAGHVAVEQAWDSLEPLLS
ncbi:MAG: patatin-like phospholipase family protein [Sphingomonadaceae bacterium]|nr:patatin-like phospholipase family protein [Sphingomonadaceae bacterium]